MNNENQQTTIDIALKQINQAIINSKNPDATTKRTGEYRIGLKKAMEILENLKEMEKEKMIEFAQEVFRNRYNQITQSLGNIADDIYNETYGGDK